MATLSVLTIALNEEQNLPECLSSVAWADEIIVIDSGSTDGTMSVAKRFTTHVHTIEWQGYGAARNFALSKASGDWVLWLDADERVTPELAEEIRNILHSDSHDVCGYTVARRAYFLGRWIRHSGWYPSRVVRLFRRGKATFSETRVHEELIVAGNVGLLRNDLLHYTDPDLHHYFQKFNRYTTLAAEDMKAAGRSFLISDMLLRPPFLFLKMYLFRAGFLDGMQGFILSVASSAYVFVKYAKLWEATRK